MTPRPPSPTLLLLSTPPSLLIGIDLLTFTTPATGTFLGIHSLPAGWHFLFASPTSSVSTREGFWFYIPTAEESLEPSLIVREWDKDSGSLLPCEDEVKVNTVTSGLFTNKEWWEKSVTPYRQPIDPSPWPSLIANVDETSLQTFTASPSLNISTTSCSAQDREPIPGLNNAEIDSALGERELGVLGIDLKRTWPEGAVGRKRTEAARDRSWALENVETRWWERWRDESGKSDEFAVVKVNGSKGHQLSSNGKSAPTKYGDVTLAYLQLSFLTLLTLQNWSCLQEWKRILGLVLTCKTAIRTRSSFFAEFLQLLQLQLERMDDIEDGLFDMLDASLGAEDQAGGSGGGGNYLLALIKGFRRILSELSLEHEGEGEGEDNDAIREVSAALRSVESWCTNAYGWDLSAVTGASTQLKSGVFELEDGETVDLDMQRDVVLEEYEETGDWAPVVVELR